MDSFIQIVNRRLGREGRQPRRLPSRMVTQIVWREFSACVDDMLVECAEGLALERMDHLID